MPEIDPFTLYKQKRIHSCGGVKRWVVRFTVVNIKNGLSLSVLWRELEEKYKEKYNAGI